MTACPTYSDRTKERTCPFNVIDFYNRVPPLSHHILFVSCQFYGPTFNSTWAGDIRLYTESRSIVVYFILILTKYASQEDHVRHSLFLKSKAFQAKYGPTSCSTSRSQRGASLKCSGKRNFASVSAGQHSV